MEAYAAAILNQLTAVDQLFVLCILSEAEPDLSEHNKAMSDLKQLIDLKELIPETKCDGERPVLQNAYEAATQLSQKEMDDF